MPKTKDSTPPQDPREFVCWANDQHEDRIPEPFPGLTTSPWEYSEWGSGEWGGGLSGTLCAVKFLDCHIWDSEEGEPFDPQEALEWASDIARNAAAWIAMDIRTVSFTTLLEHDHKIAEAYQDHDDAALDVALAPYLSEPRGAMVDRLLPLAQRIEDYAMGNDVLAADMIGKVAGQMIAIMREPLKGRKS